VCIKGMGVFVGRWGARGQCRFLSPAAYVVQRPCGGGAVFYANTGKDSGGVRAGVVVLNANAR